MKSIEVVAAVIFDEQGLLRTIDYDYPAFHLTMHCFKCKLSVSHVTLLEHEAAKWLKAKDLDSVKWLPADEEIINELKR